MERKNVYLVNVADEDLSMLPDIKCGGDITYRILNENEPDLLLPSVMQRYYMEYFSRQKENMDYPTKSDGYIYDLLSENKKGYYAFINKGETNFPALRQAFQSAGEFVHGD